MTLEYIKNSIPIYYDEKFCKQTSYHKIDPQHGEYTTKMFRCMKAYKFPNAKSVHWILANRSLTLNNIQFLEGEGWEIIKVETTTPEIQKAKGDFGYDQANIKIVIRKKRKAIISPSSLS